MKTPEQIARQAMTGPRWAAVDPWGVWQEGREAALIGAIASAIEADRAQRAAALDALHAWAVSVSDFMSTDKSNDWSEELTRLVEIEREHNLVDDDDEWQETQK